MPWVLDGHISRRRPEKRRKITETLAMARYGGEATEPGTGHEPSLDEGRPYSRRPSWDEPEIRTSDREELIQCIKRGQRPTWVPKPNLEALCAEADAHAEARPEPRPEADQECHGQKRQQQRPGSPSVPAQLCTREISLYQSLRKSAL
jgi:hypothetical protein